MPSKIEATRLALEAELARAKKWVQHFEENGIHNTVWHDTVRRLEQALGEPVKAKPKAVPEFNDEEMEEIEDGS